MDMDKPVAWMDEETGCFVYSQYDYENLDEHGKDGLIPLYIHPVKKQKCMVLNCENHKHEGSFNGDICSPCYQFIAHGKGTYSQACRNTHPVKELTDAEIMESCHAYHYTSNPDYLGFARAILRKAREK